MTTPTQTKKHPGVSPNWSNLPRRKCDDCGKGYKPVRPVKEGERGFCSANCRKSYHKHGGAYRKLKGEMQKMVARQMTQLRSDFRAMVQEELRKYAQYARVVEDFAPTLRIPAQPVDVGLSKPAAHRANR
jgi:hypothetical protein